MASEKVQVGRICGVQGLRGELKVLPLTDFPERFQGLKEIWIEHGARSRKYSIESIRTHKQYLIFKFSDINNRDAAQFMVKGVLCVDEDEIYPLPEGSHYIFQLIGLDVVDKQRGLLGKLEEVLQTGANDVYIVKGDKYKEVLIPVIKDVVLDIDTANRTITVDLLPGLIDEVEG